MLAFIRFINSNGILVTSFPGVKELQLQDYDSVFSATQCILNDYNLPEKLKQDPVRLAAEQQKRRERHVL